MCKGKNLKNLWLVVKVLETNENHFNYEVVPSKKIFKRRLSIGEEVNFFNKKTSRPCKGTVLFISPSRRSAEGELKKNYDTYLASTSTSCNSSVFGIKSNEIDPSTLLQSGKSGDIDSDRQGVSDSDRCQQYTSCEGNKTSTPYQDRNADIFNLKFDVASQTDPLPELLSADTIDELKSAITPLMDKFNYFSDNISNIIKKYILDRISDNKKVTELQEELARLRERLSDNANTSESPLIEPDIEQIPRRSSERGTDQPKVLTTVTVSPKSQPTSKESTG